MRRLKHLNPPAKQGPQLSPDVAPTADTICRTLKHGTHRHERTVLHVVSVVEAAVALVIGGGWSQQVRALELDIPVRRDSVGFA